MVFHPAQRDSFIRIKTIDPVVLDLDYHEVMQFTFAQEDIAKSDTTLFEAGVDPAFFTQMHRVFLKKIGCHGEFFHLVGTQPVAE
jgi:hypothetical protein